MSNQETVIDDFKITSFLSRPDLTRAFPFLLKKSDLNKGCCGKKRWAVDFDHIKRAIANLPPNDQVKFKSLIGASSVLVYLPGQEGKGIVPIRF